MAGGSLVLHLHQRLAGHGATVLQQRLRRDELVQVHALLHAQAPRQTRAQVARRLLELRSQVLQLHLLNVGVRGVRAVQPEPVPRLRHRVAQLALDLHVLLLHARNSVNLDGQVVHRQHHRVPLHHNLHLVAQGHQPAHDAHTHLEGDARGDDEGPVGDKLLKHEGVLAVAGAHAQPCLTSLGVLVGRQQVDVRRLLHGALDFALGLRRQERAHLLLGHALVRLEGVGGVLQT
mmetsp:Transcript_7598/g.14315  ORF Transcript_7598/g.14315 Transcript_7598/m.14315 type:complete len:233 (-) Transcript_7598:521-1219(-)